MDEVSCMFACQSCTFHQSGRALARPFVLKTDYDSTTYTSQGTLFILLIGDEVLVAAIPERAASCLLQVICSKSQRDQIQATYLGFIILISDTKPDGKV
jgi:hypothetical protein